MKTVAVIGANGYVGRAFAEMVDKKYRVLAGVREKSTEGKYITYDTNIIEDQIELSKADLGVVCVPTPSNEDGSCDTSIVESVVSWLNTPVILIKSTVAPGTCERLSKQYNKRIVFSPEYVGESSYKLDPPYDYNTDMSKTPWFIAGGTDEDVNYVFDMIVPVLGAQKKYHKCTVLEAELIKYMENTYFGVKVTFAQEMYRICQAFGADWYRVWQGWALDNRVDQMHTAVFPDAKGFSGKCLPKDLNALVKASMEKGYQPTMLSAMIQSNAEVRADEPVRFK